MNTTRIMDDDELRSFSFPPGEGAGLKTAQGHLPLVAMDVRARVLGTMAHVVVTQTFHNAFPQPLEATYVFPLPETAAVTGFSLRLKDRLVEGVLKERGEARAEYDRAIDNGQRAAIVEQERSDVFTMRVGNIASGALARAEVRLSWPITVKHGEAMFRFPLVVAPRYVPGAALPGPQAGDGVELDTDMVPDASRITPPRVIEGHPNPVRLALSVDLDAGAVDVANLRASLHVVDESVERGRRVIRLKDGERLDRDFILRFALASEALGAMVHAAPDDDGKGGTFAVTIVPPSTVKGPPAPRDVVFLLDQSGSMQGWKWEASRRATCRLVDALTEHDRFNVLLFQSDVSAPLGDGMRAATDAARFDAIQKLSTEKPDGGTEMGRALHAAARLLARAREPGSGMLVLITDGQVANGPQLLTEMASALRGVRVFAVGVDEAVSAGLLSELATQHAGWFELVESEQRLEAVMSRMKDSLRAPVMKEVSVALDGVKVVGESVRPARLVDLYAGMPVVMAGRYEGPMPVRAEVRMQGNVEATLSVEKAPREIIVPAWARMQLGVLERRYAQEPLDGTEREIVATSLRANVLSRFTAFVAVDSEGERVDRGPVHRITQPVEDPRNAPRVMAKKAVGFRGFQDAPAAAAPKERVSHSTPVAPSGEGRSVFRRRASKTQAGVLRGKFGFMSPEMVRGLPLDGRSDVFALAIVLYELLEGERLFQADSDFSLLEAIRNVELPNPLFRRKDCDALLPLMEGMLARDTDQRPSMQQVKDAVDALLASSDVRAAPYDLVEGMHRLYPEAIARAKALQWDTPSRTLGPIDVFEQIVNGGESAVHRARLHRGDGSTVKVLLKVMHPYVCEDPEFADVFREVMRATTHPGLQRVEGAFRSADGIWMEAAEWFTGVDVQQFIRARREQGYVIPVRHALHIIRDAAAALIALHALGAVHRSVSPFSIAVGFDGVVKLLDHGAPGPAIPVVTLQEDWGSTTQQLPPRPPAPRRTLGERIRAAFWK